jgi:hypothetical protein
MHPFVTSDGSSDNFRRCAPLLAVDGDLLRRTRDAIAAYTPLAAERVAFPQSCEACPEVDTPAGDPSCGECPWTDQIRTTAKLHKVSITLGDGLQILDLSRVKLGSKSALILHGQENTVLVVRLQKQLLLGAEAKVFATDNGTGNGALRSNRILWNLDGPSGGQVRFTRDSLFTGTVLAPDRPGARVGAGVVVDGAIYSGKIHLTADCTIHHFPFTALLPVQP